MNGVVSTAIRARFLRAGVAQLALVATFAALGCGRGGDAKAVKTAHTAPVLESPRQITALDAASQMDDAKDERQSVPVDEDDLWVPMTGEEKVIADKIEILTDGASVRAAPDERDSTATSAARPAEE